MELGSELKKVRRKWKLDQVRRWIGKDEQRFAELMQLVLFGDAIQRQKGSWVLTNICNRKHYLAQPYLSAMLDHLEKEGDHQGVYRSLIRVFTKCELPKQLHGRITEIMFAIAAEPNRSVAEKVFALQTSVRMVKLYPELARELECIIEEVQKQTCTPAMRVSIREAQKAIANTQRSS